MIYWLFATLVLSSLISFFRILRWKSEIKWLDYLISVVVLGSLGICIHLFLNWNGLETNKIEYAWLGHSQFNFAMDWFFELSKEKMIVLSLIVWAQAVMIPAFLFPRVNCNPAYLAKFIYTLNFLSFGILCQSIWAYIVIISVLLMSYALWMKVDYIENKKMSSVWIESLREKFVGLFFLTGGLLVLNTLQVDLSFGLHSSWTVWFEGRFGSFLVLVGILFGLRAFPVGNFAIGTDSEGGRSDRYLSELIMISLYSVIVINYASVPGSEMSEILSNIFFIASFLNLFQHRW